MRLTIAIQNQQRDLLAKQSGEDFISLVYAAPYQEGDFISLSCGGKNAHLVVQLDEVLNPAQVYLTEGEFLLKIPFAEKRVSYSPKTFDGEIHLLSARIASEAEVSSYRNLAENCCDCHENQNLFPHASANVETRGESVFAARNATNGNKENHSHGPWPYESWGINRDPNAELTLNFGRPVDADKIVLTTRADFPHDNWWKQATFTFSDGSTETVPMEKSDKEHVFPIKKRTITWLKLGNLLTDENDPSPFPALSQIEVYGRESSPPEQ